MSKKIEEYSTKELIRRDKTLKYLLYFALAIITFYGLVMMYMMSVGQWNERYYLIIVPIVVTIMAIVIAVLRKLLFSELKRRK